MHKRSLLLSAAFVATALLAQAATGDTPRKAGEFVIHMNGKEEKLLSAYRGKVVVMAFMYTTCPHCQHTAGVLATIQTEYAAKGVQILGTVFDQSAQRDFGAFVTKTGANFPVGYSTPDQVTKFMHSGDDYYVPMLAFIDRTGTIRLAVISHGDDPGDEGNKFLLDQEKAIRKEIDTLLKSSDGPATKSTKAAPKAAAKAAPKP